MPILVNTPITINGINYDVEKMIGKGGLSVVYLAKEQSTKRKVAIKEFLYTKFYDPLTHENDCEENWENEILNTQAQARSGKRCVEVLNFEKRCDLQTPEFYIVLSFIEGLTFLEFYRQFILECRGLENLDITTMVRFVFLPLAELLEYCHSVEHIVHRDFAVSNIIIQKDKTGDIYPVLIDWGVSKYLGPEWVYYTPKPYMLPDMPRDLPVTQKGAPPEVRSGYIPCAASDIYYMGHLMYFVFTGGIMREDSDNAGPQDFVLNPKAINIFIPDEFNKVVAKLTQYEPADRPKSMTEVIAMLKSLITIDYVHFDFSYIGEPDSDEKFAALPEELSDKDKNAKK
jgi:serine/threonine protein kinase